MDVGSSSSRLGMSHWEVGGGNLWSWGWRRGFGVVVVEVGVEDDGVEVVVVVEWVRILEMMFKLGVRELLLSSVRLLIKVDVQGIPVDLGGWVETTR